MADRLKNIIYGVDGSFIGAFGRFFIGRSALSELGWFKSVIHRQSIDRYGNPIPWISYPTIAYLADKNTKKLAVFEFGSGNSTKWWASRAKSITSCEHDLGWYEKVKATL